MPYPSINPYVIISKQSRMAIDVTTGKHIDLPPGAFPLLRMVDGHTDIETICAKAKQTYNAQELAVRNFFANLSRKGFLTLSAMPQNPTRKGKAPIRVASIELTDKCNLKCVYCYGHFAPSKNRILTFNEASNLFNSLAKRNVRVVELSGGEPTTNPQFDEIFEYACKLFMSVTIMTNAVTIRDSTYKTFRDHSDKVNFSISIDGFSEATNDSQRGVHDTFRKTIDNILRIKQEINPKLLRVVYMLTEENEAEADALFDFMISHGILDVMVSIPENVDKGRSRNLPNSCSTCENTNRPHGPLGKRLEEIGDKYATKIRTVGDRLGKSGLQIANAIPTCGAGWTMLSFQADGRVMPCNMMNDKWCLGNFKEDPSLDFLSFNNQLYEYFANFNLSADDGNRAECEKCAYNSYCDKYINKVMLANKRRAEQGLPTCPVLARNKSLTPCEL